MFVREKEKEDLRTGLLVEVVTIHPNIFDFWTFLMSIIIGVLHR